MAASGSKIGGRMVFVPFFLFLFALRIKQNIPIYERRIHGKGIIENSKRGEINWRSMALRLEGEK